MEASTPVKPLDQAASGAETRAGALPNLIVIGAQKCGTSVLHYYLSLHPEVSMSKPKELNFFIEERNWPRGIDWYKSQFDADARVRGEASPNYTAFPQHQGVPERMASVVPDAKLIYMVRDPLERIAAHWVHNYAKRREKGTLAETLVHPNTSYVTRSKYAMQLERFLEHYPKEQVLVFQQSELRHKRMETLRQVFEFIGVDADVRAPALRAGAPPDLGQDAGDAARRSAREDGPQPPRAPLAVELLARARRPPAPAPGDQAPRRARLAAARHARGAARRRRTPARADRPRLLQLEDLGRLIPAGPG